LAAAAACALILYLPIFDGNPHLAFLLAGAFAGAGIALAAGTREGCLAYRGILLIAASLGISLGGALGTLLSFEKSREYFGFPVGAVLSYSGTLVDDPRPAKGDLTMLSVEIDSVSSSRGEASAKGNLRIFLRATDRVSVDSPNQGNSTPFNKGARVRVLGRGQKTDDGDAYLLFANAKDIRVLSKGKTLDVLRSRIKRKALAALDGIGGDGVGLFKALFLGVKDDLEDDETEAFKRSGCVHILALSGMHLTILATLLCLLLMPMLGKNPTMLISLFLIIFYVFVTGVQPSIFRAALMYFLLVVSQAFDRRTEGLTLLSLSFLIAVCLDPSSAKTLSFILSYLALFGIFALSGDLEILMRRWLPPFAAKPLAASIAAQIATSPVAALYFGTVYPGGILTSAVSGPLVTVFMWTGMASTILSITSLPFLGHASSAVLSLEYRLLMGVINAGGRLPPLVVSTAISKAVFFVVLALMVFLLYLVARTRIFRGARGWKGSSTIRRRH
jgi:competence protein ComEC